MLTRSQLEAHIAAKGPYLYHRAPAEALPLIASQGVLPWDHEERGDITDDWDEVSTTSYANSRMTPRSDHVYVGALGYVRRYDGITLRVDLRELDPLSLAADEDHFDLRRYNVPEALSLALPDGPPREWGSWENYIDPACAACEGAGGDCLACGGSGKDYDADIRDEESLGDWADRHSAVIDQPEFVAYSLESGSIAVKGALPAQALSIDPLQLQPKQLEQVARAFADVDLAVAPFAVSHAGETFQVNPDVKGVFGLPAGWPRWKVEGCVQQARGEQVLELLNGGRLSALGIESRPQLSESMAALRAELEPAPLAEALSL